LAVVHHQQKQRRKRRREKSVMKVIQFSTKAREKQDNFCVVYVGWWNNIMEAPKEIIHNRQSTHTHTHIYTMSERLFLLVMTAFIGSYRFCCCPSSAAAAAVFQFTERKVIIRIHSIKSDSI